MAKRAHIVSFDDAKREARNKRENTRASSRRSEQVASSSKGSSRAAAPAQTTSSYERKTLVSGFGERRSSSARTTRAAVSAQEEPRDNTQRSTKSTKREQRQRSRAKARAGKLFEKQNIAASDSSQDEQSPRAALYEGKMGSTQRKSARMQRSSEASAATAKINPAGWFTNLSLTPRSIRIATVALCFVLLGAFLYVPAQQYYQAQREHDRLTAEYAVIEQRNEVLDQQNDSLASNAGMEDAVRQKYGYVKTGDQTAVVTGLSEATTDTSRDGENIEANVLSSSVKAPEAWYTPILDAFFGVD